MVTPAIRELRKAFPSANISILVGKWSSPALRNNPYLNNIIDFDDRIFFKKQVFKLILLIIRLRIKRFDTAIIFHPSTLIHLFALLSGIKTRYGLRRNKRGWFLTKYIDENCSRDYYYPKNHLNLLSLLGVESDNVALDAYYGDLDKEHVISLLRNNGINSNDKIVLVGAGGAFNPKEAIVARHWPKEYYVELLGMIHSKYPHLKLILTGSQNDSRLNEFIHSQTPFIFNFTGKTNLAELFYLAEISKVIICNDSALLHIAVAKKKPVICFFGPTNLKTRIPRHLQKYSLQSPVSCSPCYKFAIFKKCTQNNICMHEIKPNIAFNNFVIDMKPPHGDN